MPDICNADYTAYQASVAAFSIRLTGPDSAYEAVMLAREIEIRDPFGKSLPCWHPDKDCLCPMQHHYYHGEKHADLAECMLPANTFRSN